MTGLTTHHKCAHAPCKCSATFGTRYCSDFCEDRAMAPLEDGGNAGEFAGCGCGHAECITPSSPVAD